MKKINFFALSILPSVCFIPLLSKKCNNTIKVQIDENIITRKYLKRLTLHQIINLHNITPFLFIIGKSQEKKYLEGLLPSANGNLLLDKNNKRYTLDFEFRKPWNQIISNYNNIKVVQDNKNSNEFSALFTEYKFEDIKKYDGYNASWFYFLSGLAKKDYYRIGDPYFFDFQTIIFRLVEDIKINKGLVNNHNIVNKKGEAVFLNNIFKNQYIQAVTWLTQEANIFRETFFKFLVLYLNKFNLNIKEIKVNWLKTEIKPDKSSAFDFVSFKLSEIIDFNNKNIITDEIKNKTFYIDNFRNYQTNLKFGIGQKGLQEKLPLFNDYVQNPILKIKSTSFLDVQDNINNFIKGYQNIDYWNSKGLVYLFTKFKDKLLFLDVPKIYKDVDEKYEIEDVQFTNYFDTDQIIKLIIKVIKKSGEEKRYVLLSQNFDDHGHLLKGLILKNLSVDKLKSTDFFTFRENIQKAPKGILLDDFIDENDSSKPFASLVKEAILKMNTKWENRNLVNAESILKDNDNLLMLTAHLNNYLLAYALENEEEKIHTGIKKIELDEIKGNNNGTLELTFNFYKFLNEKDLDFKTKNETPFYKLKLQINGFLNYSGSEPNGFKVLEKRKI
ncbi:MAG3240 family lipoprotein [Metamycoplasma hyosynoviae]|uniref:Lipoprotein n=10 Tax=Metamycoplasma hyosynoviae TaxID=29559 RepID=A0A063YL48_9BACT|nr:hypothetical protein [Metamycoplasma hyosynoviae]ASI53994.1 hypothetical protein MHSN_02230 [Metamycoplasma hyosynoviae]KDE41863.1 hypothetical protein NPL7_02045 [Metamycoplasma hyosynoviae]KDE42574.1 hypothetical protein NPL3_01165 [Metamycoplasma hyosynoviae]KDE43269.1 hypothetical protein NPL5_02710 [Metamycoplasma hyosynoviae]KDE44987.1 hypothetical protein NPL6_00400 [Metamycoplasma hyosynoviae]